MTIKRPVLPRGDNRNPGTNFKEYTEWNERQIDLKKHIIITDTQI